METNHAALKERARFQQELEFVQCLANPAYVQYLAQHLYLDDPKFVAYLRYLRYWKEPEYARFIIYPSALRLLDVICDNPEQAAKAFKDPNFSEMTRIQQFYSWQDHVHN